MLRMLAKDALQSRQQMLLILSVCTLFVWLDPLANGTPAFIVLFAVYTVTLRVSFEEERSGTLAFLASLPVTRGWVVGVKFAEALLFAAGICAFTALVYIVVHGSANLLAESALVLPSIVAAGTGGVLLAGLALLLFFGSGYRAATGSMWALLLLVMAAQVASRLPAFEGAMAAMAGSSRWFLGQSPTHEMALMVAAGAVIFLLEYGVASQLLSRRDLA